MNSLIQQFFQWITLNYIEFIAVIFGIAGVWLTAKQIIWCWPVAIVNVILSTWIFYDSKLYQDSILQVFYLVMAVYGWHNWLYGGKNKSELKVNRISTYWAFVLLLGGSACIYIFGWFFSRYTDASLPYLDATTTVWGIIGTFMMARKIIENWAVWILIDILNTGIYFYKELYGFAVLYFIFTMLAVYGLIAWIRDYRKMELA